MLWNCAAVPEGFCSVALQCGFAVGCEDSEDTGFCPLRIMWCAPEQETLKEPSIYAVYKHICLNIGNYLATDFPYSMNKITL